VRPAKQAAVERWECLVVFIISVSFVVESS